jgi:hypothetical protein
MATPHHPPNAGTVKKDEKPKKDAWDKADIVIKALIPTAVAFIGWQIQNAVITQSTGKDYIQIALGILQSTSPEAEKKASFSEKQRNKDLRSWAVSLLNKTSPLPFPQKTADELINGETEIPYFSALAGTVPLIGEAIIQKSPLLTLLTHSIQVSSPSGRLVAFLKNDGSVFVTGSSSLLPMLGIETKLTSPKGLIFSPDEWNLIVFGEQTFVICASEGHISQDLPRYNAPIRVSPLNGISNIRFSDDSKAIIVKGMDNKEIRYDLDGKEIK